MEHLQQLIKGLNKSEKKMTRKHLAAFGSNGKKDTIGLALFDLLDKRKRVLSNKDCANILFGKDEKNRIRVLKSRVKQKVLDALSMDIVIKNLAIDIDSKTSIQLKKKLMQFQILLFTKKANPKTLDALLQDVIEKATEYELYAILVETYNLKKLLIGFRKGVEPYNEFRELAEKALDAQVKFTTIVDDYYQLLLTYRSNKPKKERIAFLKNVIREGNKSIKATNSKIGTYYLNVIKYAYFHEMNDLHSANITMKDQLELLNSSIAAKRNDRYGATYDYLCQTNIQLGNYNEAYHYASNGKKYFKSGELNYSVAQELEFRSLLYANRLPEAENTIRSIRKQYKEDMDAHRLSTHKFLLANLYFAKRAFKKCNRLLSQDYEFKNDRTGWEFNLRILHIMCLLEQEKVEDAHIKYSNLLRLLERYKSEQVKLTSRNKLILKALKQWLDSGANKLIAKMNNSALLEKMESTRNQWDPLTSELIPFDQWLRSKL